MTHGQIGSVLFLIATVLGVLGVAWFDLRRTVYVSHWYDRQHKGFRVAGVYTTRDKAERRVAELSRGAVQTLRMNRPVRFIHEASQEDGPQ